MSPDAWGHGGVSPDECHQRLRNGLSVYSCFVFVFLPWQEEDKFGLLQRSGQQIFIKISCVPDSGNEQKDSLPP